MDVAHLLNPEPSTARLWHRSKKSSRKLFHANYQRTFLSSTLPHFSRHPNVHIVFGDTAKVFEGVVQAISGRILFWLDGHYSGPGTALGDDVCPILAELDVICQLMRADHCILIDDVRLFTGADGYPPMDTVRTKLKEINPQYEIRQDWD